MSTESVTHTWTDTFSHLCKTCGVLVQVVAGKAVPHRCRIDLDAQHGRDDAV